MRTVCAHEELLRGGLAACRLVCWCIWTGDFKIVCVCPADLCRDQFSRCGVAALSGGCSSLGGSCGKSCGGC